MNNFSLSACTLYPLIIIVGIAVEDLDSGSFEVSPSEFSVPLSTSGIDSGSNSSAGSMIVNIFLSTIVSPAIIY